MCLIVAAYRCHPEYPLVIAANRDEFYDRPSAAASFWKDAPHILAGRDLRGGGTWLGMSTDGRLAAITNHRNPGLLKSNAPSRGLLVSDYLRGSLNAREYLEKIHINSGRYNGFNLIAGDLSELYCYSNITGEIIPITPGIHALSNHLLDTPWPKVARAKMLLGECLRKELRPSDTCILALLEDRVQPPDEELPDTGVGLEWERMLSPLFISSPFYGTCSSTAILIDGRGRAAFTERVVQSAATNESLQRFAFDFSPPVKKGLI